MVQCNPQSHINPVSCLPFRVLGDCRLCLRDTYQNYSTKYITPWMCLNAEGACCSLEGRGGLRRIETLPYPPLFPAAYDKREWERISLQSESGSGRRNARRRP